MGTNGYGLLHACLHILSWVAVLLLTSFLYGFFLQKKLNDALMGILRVRNLLSPPYISTQSSLNVHNISKSDHFVIVGSDGLFDFFSNDEAVELVHSYILTNPSGDPAKFLLEQLVLRAADCAGTILDILALCFISENSPFYSKLFICNHALSFISANMF